MGDGSEEHELTHLQCASEKYFCDAGQLVQAPFPVKSSVHWFGLHRMQRADLDVEELV